MKNAEENKKKNKRTLKVFGGLIAFFVLVGACGAMGQDATPAATDKSVSAQEKAPVSQDPTVSPKPQKAGKPKSRCVKIGANELDGYVAFKEENGYGLKWKLKDAYAVKSKTYENVWFIGAKVVAPDGSDGGVVTMARAGKDRDGLTFGVGPAAKEYLTWPNGVGMGKRLSVFDDGIGDAMRCANG